MDALLVSPEIQDLFLHIDKKDFTHLGSNYRKIAAMFGED